MQYLRAEFRYNNLHPNDRSGIATIDGKLIPLEHNDDFHTIIALINKAGKQGRIHAFRTIRDVVKQSIEQIEPEA